jgi:hypothetical protein
VPCAPARKQARECVDRNAAQHASYSVYLLYLLYWYSVYLRYLKEAGAGVRREERCTTRQLLSLLALLVQ